MRSLARVERAALADLFDELGPDQPTLCEGWRTRDLAAHLVLRESRLDTLPGIVFPVAARWTARLRAQLAASAFDDLVGRLRAGPPRFSPFRPGWIDNAANGIEFFVHHEDVRRARPGWEPRSLDPATNEYLWRRARATARMGLRGERSGVALALSGSSLAQDLTAFLVRRPRRGQHTILVQGAASELLLYVYGRRGHARVEVSRVDIGPVENGPGRDQPRVDSASKFSG